MTTAMHEGVGAKFANEAIAALREQWEPTFAWFWKLAPGPSLSTAATEPRWTVLVAMGRLHADVEIFVQTARALAALPLDTGTREALRRIDAVRAGLITPKEIAMTIAEKPDPITRTRAALSAWRSSADAGDLQRARRALEDARRELAELRATPGAGPSFLADLEAIAAEIYRLEARVSVAEGNTLRERAVRR